MRARMAADLVTGSGKPAQLGNGHGPVAQREQLGVNQEVLERNRGTQVA